jgi:hypothetical protein
MEGEEARRTMGSDRLGSNPTSATFKTCAFGLIT